MSKLVLKFSEQGQYMGPDFFLSKLEEEVRETREEVNSSSGAKVMEEVFDVMQVCVTFLVSNFEKEHIYELGQREHDKKMKERHGG